MKVRIGVGLGVNQLLAAPPELAVVVDLLEDLGFDSLWMSERVVGPALDPLAALAFAAGRTHRLKLGTSVVVLPGRNPVLLAKEIATIDTLSRGRFLPVVGLGTRQKEEHEAFGVVPSERGELFERSLAAMRACWAAGPSEDRLDVHPKPTRPPSVWFGGRGPAELRRAGRLADGWLASFQTPVETAEARQQIHDAAIEAGRVIDPDHFGTIILYSRGDVPSRASDLLADKRPDAPRELLLPSGAPELTELVGRYVDAGLSKFILIPTAPPGDWAAELSWLREATADLET